MTRAIGSSCAENSSFMVEFRRHDLSKSELVPRRHSKSFGGGGGFWGRFNFWPSDFLAFSEGLGPRTSGFFMARLPNLRLSYRAASNSRAFKVAPSRFVERISPVDDLQFKIQSERKGSQWGRLFPIWVLSLV